MLVPAANVQLSLGSLNDNGSAKSITFNGTTGNSLTLSAAATSFGAGSSIIMNGGTLLVTNPTGSATGSGSIVLPSGTSFGGTGWISTAVNIASGVTLFTGLSNNTPGKTASNLGIGSGSVLGTTLMDITGAGQSDTIVVGNGTGSVNVTNASVTVTSPNTVAYGFNQFYTLMTFGSQTGTLSTSNVSLPTLPSGYSWKLIDALNKGLFATISGNAAANNLTWDNVSALGNGTTWDTTTPNWASGGGAYLYSNGDTVTFNDTNNGHYAVTINSIVSPASTTVANSAGNYTFSGAGGIGGAGSLTKSGTSSLTLAVANTYSGATNVGGGSLVLANKNALPGGTALTIVSGASVVANTLGAAYGLRVSSLNDSGTLDLNNNAIAVHGSTLAAISGLVQTGYNNSAWNGTGIISTAAAGNTSRLTTLGVIVNDNGTGTPLYGARGSINSTFEGAVAGDILVKYTYYGDTNPNGRVDGSDYSRIDAGFLADQTAPGAMTGCYNGDFNYDDVIDGSDYTLMDNAYNSQGGAIAAACRSRRGSDRATQRCQQFVSPRASLAWTCGHWCAGSAGPSAPAESRRQSNELLDK